MIWAAGQSCFAVFVFPLHRKSKIESNGGEMKRINFTILACMSVAAISRGSENNGAMETNGIFPKGRKAEANFTGTAWGEFLVAGDTVFDTQVYNVTFEPGSRNYRRSHTGGQLLLVTSGEGYYQEEGRSVRMLQPGDVVGIHPGVVHWHGAMPGSELAHTGIGTQAGKGPAQWLGPVSDDDHNSCKK